MPFSYEVTLHRIYPRRNIFFRKLPSFRFDCDVQAIMALQGHNVNIRESDKMHFTALMLGMTRDEKSEMLGAIRLALLAGEATGPWLETAADLRSITCQKLQSIHDLDRFR